MLKAVIFDLDGTLIDSEPVWNEVDYKLAKKYNFPLTDEFRKQLTGRGIRECAELFVSEFKLDMSPEAFMNERQELMYQILFEKLQLMPYASELLQSLKSRGLRLALATAGHEVTKAKKILEKLAIVEYFPTIVSGLDVKNSKPAPDIFIETAKKLSLAPADCIVIEDAVNGVIAAKAAGCRAVGVNKDANFQEGFKKEKADFIFENLNIPDKVFF